jgi:2-polyprenyl-3-methyl-5-hydroxy-6-metoxy-1,4-benzoquinol methylase
VSLRGLVTPPSPRHPKCARSNVRISGQRSIRRPGGIIWKVLSRDEFIYHAHVEQRHGDSRYRLVQLTGESSAILDAGCAVGYIGEFLRRTNPPRWLAGIELDPRAAELARPHYDQVIVGSLEDEKVWDQLERDVDAMIFGDVLEHTTDPVRVLGLASRHLTDGGIVVISMPNVAHFKVRLRLLAGRFEYQEWGIMDRTHLRFFTLATARNMVDSSGFEVLHTEAIHAFPPPLGGSAVRRAGRAAKARARYALGTLWPTLFAYQFIIVGRRKSDITAERGDQTATSISR